MEPTPLSPGDFWRPLQHEGRSRNYLVHAPPSYRGEPTPVVLALHGATSNARLMEKFTDLTRKSDEAGFMIVYPNGTGNSTTVLTWNGGNDFGYAAKNNVDDVGFLLAIVDDLSQAANVDPARVYICGMSNGAQMAYRAAAEAPERFAAVAGVAGPIGMRMPTPRAPMPVLHIHGTDDQFAPFLGGKGPKSIYGAEFASVAKTVETWVEVNGCERPPRVAHDPSIVNDGTTIRREFYPSGSAGCEVTLIVVEGGGHTWPGRPPLPATLGKSTANLNANDAIWQFFSGR